MNSSLIQLQQKRVCMCVCVLINVAKYFSGNILRTKICIATNIKYYMYNKLIYIYKEWLILNISMHCSAHRAPIFSYTSAVSKIYKYTQDASATVIIWFCYVGIYIACIYFWRLREKHWAVIYVRGIWVVQMCEHQLQSFISMTTRGLMERKIKKQNSRFHMRIIKYLIIFSRTHNRMCTPQYDTEK